MRAVMISALLMLVGVSLFFTSCFTMRMLDASPVVGILLCVGLYGVVGVFFGLIFKAFKIDTMVLLVLGVTSMMMFFISESFHGTPSTWAAVQFYGHHEVKGSDFLRLADKGYWTLSDVEPVAWCLGEAESVYDDDDITPSVVYAHGFRGKGQEVGGFWVITNSRVVSESLTKSRSRMVGKYVRHRDTYRAVLRASKGQCVLSSNAPVLAYFPSKISTSQLNQTAWIWLIVMSVLLWLVGSVMLARQDKRSNAVG